MGPYWILLRYKVRNPIFPIWIVFVSRRRPPLYWKNMGIRALAQDVARTLGEKLRCLRALALNGSFSFGNRSSRKLPTQYFSSTSASATKRKEMKKLEISGIRLTKCSVFGPLESGIRSSANTRFFQIFLLDRWC